MNLIISEVVKKVNDSNNIHLDVTSENFEKEINKALQFDGEPEQKIIILDSLVNMDEEHNPTTSICSLLRSYMKDGDKESTLLVKLLTIIKRFENFYDSNQSIDKVFGNINEDYTEVTKTFKDLLIYGSLTKFLELGHKYEFEVKKSKEECIEKFYMLRYPKFSEELKQIISCGDEYQLYYHGTDSNMISSKICNEGLYMQYGEIRRTAVPNLSFPDIINYSYGHENVGRHSMVIIMFPKGESVVEINQESSVVLAGTGQGKEGISEFNPKYMISSSHIYGIIDKDNKQIIKNPNFILKENQHARS